MSREEIKAAFKESMKEWLDEKFADFGKWTLGAFFAALFGAMAYFIFYVEGWRR